MLKIIPTPVLAVAKRLFLGILTLFLVTLLIFLAIQLLPGDLAQAVLGQAATKDTVEAFRRELGLDQPAYIRYLSWLMGVLHGDLGHSLASGRAVSDMIAGRLGNTLFLALYTAAIAVPLSIGLGLAAALFRHRLFDRLANLVTLSAISFPEFFIAYILIYFLGQSGLFPTIIRLDDSMGWGQKLYQCFLPALTLTLIITAHMMRMTRAAIINLLALPYIEMAKLKGLSPWRIIIHHALPNALAPIINVVSLSLAYLITGVVVVEVVFVYPGLGQLIVDAVSKRDVVVVQSTALIFASAYIGLNMISDLLSTLTNPRLRNR